MQALPVWEKLHSSLKMPRVYLQKGRSVAIGLLIHRKHPLNLCFLTYPCV